MQARLQVPNVTAERPSAPAKTSTEKRGFMLTAKQNFLETITPGGHPDRFVNQYEMVGVCIYPYSMDQMPPQRGELHKVNPWGITFSFREDQPGAFPEDTPDKLVIKDFEEWDQYVKAPNIDYPEAAWEPFIKYAEEQINHDEQFVTPFVAPGIFEQMHNLGGMTDTLAAFYEYPDECHELIKYLVDWELKLADGICNHLPVEMMLHHDDWGSRTSTFMSPDMWAEFFLEPYKTLYGYWHERGCQYIIHHSDSYGKTLIPYMIEIGINVWQGVMTSNDIADCIEKYGDKIAFMGGLDGADIEKADWTKPWVKEQVQKICKEYGHKSFIPCITQGMPMSTYDGLYDCISECIAGCSEEMKDTFND